MAWDGFERGFWIMARSVEDALAIAFISVLFVDVLWRGAGCFPPSQLDSNRGHDGGGGQGRGSLKRDTAEPASSSWGFLVEFGTV